MSEDNEESIDIQHTDVRERDGSMVVTIPAELAESCGLEVGEKAMVSAEEDGAVTFLPSDEDSIRDMLGLD